MCFFAAAPVAAAGAGTAAAGAGTAAAGTAAAGAGTAAAAAGTAATASALSTWSLALMGLGTGLSALSVYGQGVSAQEQAKAQSKIMSNNAKIARWQSEDAERIGQLNERQTRLKTESIIGAQNAAFAKAGVAVDAGTPVDVTSDTSAWGEWEAQMERHNTAKAIWGYQNQAAGSASQANMYNVAGGNAYQAGLFGAGGSLMTGAGMVASDWYKQRSRLSDNDLHGKSSLR